jgi:hypothetical protein
MTVNSILFACRGDRDRSAVAYGKCVSHRADNLQVTVYRVSIVFRPFIGLVYMLIIAFR